MYMSRKYSEKLENICGVIYFAKSVELHTIAYLKWNPTKVFRQKFDAGVPCSIKIQKKLSPQ